MNILKNGGINWLTRTTTISIWDFIELTDNGNEILDTTTKGLYYSKNEGQNWLKHGYISKEYKLKMEK